VARAKDALGRLGEDVAVAHLRSAGLAVLDRNWRCRQGEIDVVALDVPHRELVVCEVKTRTSDRFGVPVECVTPAKLARLRRLAGAWLGSHPDVSVRTVRIDVVGIICPPGAAPTVVHVRAVDT